ncbi:DUF4221 family protein [Algoriphagus antarcticus]|nr:DUF4221 family protein [Algoriphagus antarcticus]
MELVSLNILEYPLDSSLRFSTNSIGVTNIEGKEYLSFLDTELETLVIFEYQDSKKSRKIQFQYEGPNGVGNSTSSAHYLHSFDSIYIFHHWTGVLLHMTDSGKIINRYKLTDYDDPANLPMPFPTTTTPILFSQGKLFIPCTITKYQNDYHSYPSSLSLDLNTRKIKYLSTFPEIYSNAYWGSKFKYEPSIAYNSITDELVVSYPVDHFLQNINLKTRKVSQHYVGSEYFDAIPPFKYDVSHYLTRTKGTGDQEEDDHGMSNSDYRGIYYDNSRNLYYRIALIRSPLEKLSITKVPDFSIIILNANFEKWGEHYFSSQVYDPSKVFLSSKGINIFR